MEWFQAPFVWSAGAKPRFAVQASREISTADGLTTEEISEAEGSAIAPKLSRA